MSPKRSLPDIGAVGEGDGRGVGVAEGLGLGLVLGEGEGEAAKGWMPFVPACFDEKMEAETAEEMRATGVTVLSSFFVRFFIECYHIRAPAIARIAFGSNGMGAGVGVGAGVAEAVMPRVPGGVPPSDRCRAVSARPEAVVAIKAAGWREMTMIFATFFIGLVSHPQAIGNANQTRIEWRRCGSRRWSRRGGSSHAARGGRECSRSGRVLRGERQCGSGGRDQGCRTYGRDEGFRDIFHRRGIIA